MICEPICVRCLSSATHSSLVCIFIHLASYLSIYLSIYLLIYLSMLCMSTVQYFKHSYTFLFCVDMQEYTLCTTRGQIKLKKRIAKKNRTRLLPRVSSELSRQFHVTASGRISWLCMRTLLDGLKLQSNHY